MVSPKLSICLHALLFAQHPGELLALSTASSNNRRRQERTVVLLYNKPANVVTTHSSDDVKGRLNVYDDIRSMRGYVEKNRSTKTPPVSLEEATGVTCSNWNAVGRLDADTTGLLLVTNDGGLVHHVSNKNAKTNARAGPPGKTYEAHIMGYHNDDSPVIQELRVNGVDIGSKHGGHTLPVPDITVLGHPTEKSSLVSLTLYEGKNRQVRRMFHALGSGVMKLRRTAIGEHLSVTGLEIGQWRVLSDDEVRSALNWEPRIIERQPIATEERQGRRAGNNAHRGPSSKGKRKRRRRRTT